jgi:hypothetical protein
MLERKLLSKIWGLRALNIIGGNMKIIKPLTFNILRQHNPHIPDEQIEKALEDFSYYMIKPNDTLMLYSEKYAIENGYIIGKEENKLSTLKQLFLNDIEDLGKAPKVLVVAIKLPNDAIEVITNSQNIDEKIKYYKENYNDDLRLKHNTDIKIMNWIVL